MTPAHDPRQMTGRSAVMHVVVDAANVVGSRPDGWWRDRPGAARRLLDRLATSLRTDPAALATSLGHPEAELAMIVVLEGAARKAADPSDDPDVPLRVVHAAGCGDDEVVQVVRRTQPPVVVVTADRELRERVMAAGAATMGPAALLRALPPV